MKAAIKAAKRSIAKQRVGAVLMSGKAVVSIGWNKKKTHPEAPAGHCSLHAEFCCLIGKNAHSSILFIVRLTGAGRLGYCRPCDHCAALIAETGVRRAYFIGHSGEVERLEL